MRSCIRHIIVMAIMLLGVSKMSAQVAMPDNVCIGTTRHYSVNDPSVPSTYTWTVDGVVQTTTTNEIIITWTTLGHHVITVQEHANGGCDGEIRSGDVYVNPLPNVIKDTTVCSNNIPFVWNGLTVNQAGDYPYITTSSLGCDSTTTLHVTLVNPVSVDKDTTVCANNMPFTWNGITVNQAGNYPYITTSSLGCDSTTTLHVTLVNPVSVDKDTTVCGNSIPFTWNGITVDQAGNYPYTTTSVAGCDSTTTLHVTVVNLVSVDKDTTVCANNIPLNWNGITVDQAGDYPYTTTSVAGCDSTTTLHVTVVNLVSVDNDTTVCANNIPFTWNGITVDQAGDYPYTTTSVAGCDSTTILHVTVVNTVSVDKDTTVCANNIPFTWNGITVDQAGDYPYTTTSTSGCDSTTTLHVTVANTVSVDKDTTVCANSIPFTWNGITIDQAGDYPYITTSSLGCDSTTTLHVTLVNPVVVDKDTTVCANNIPFTWNGITVNQAGDYPYITTSSLGCDSTTTL